MSSFTWSPLGGGGDTGANKALSNLTATAVNVDILPSANNTINLGSTSLAFKEVFTKKISTDSSTILTLDCHILPSVNDTWDIGIPEGPYFHKFAAIEYNGEFLQNIPGLSLLIRTIDTNPIQIFTIDQTSSTNSSDISITTGAVSTGVRGKITLSALKTVVNSDISFGGAATSITVETAAGVGATATLNYGNEKVGQVSITTGVGSTAGALFNIVFASHRPNTPTAFFQAVNTNAASLNAYIAEAADTNVKLGTQNAPTDVTTYTFNYWMPITE